MNCDKISITSNAKLVIHRFRNVLWFVLLVAVLLGGCQRVDSNAAKTGGGFNESQESGPQNPIPESVSEPEVIESNPQTATLNAELLNWDKETRTIELDQKVTSQQFSRICQLPHLETLILDGGGVTRDQIDELLRLEKLEHLRIRNLAAGNVEIKKLVGMKNLRIVNLPQANFDDGAVAMLAALPNLQLLRFSSPNVTDAGMRHLKNCKSLRALHLIRVPVTNQSAESFCEIPSLESLYLDGSQLDDHGFSKILKLKPDIHLHVDQVHLDYDPNKHEHAKD